MARETEDDLKRPERRKWYRHVLRREDNSVLRVNLNLSGWLEKMRMTKEDLEEASGRGNREGWFKDGRYPKSNGVVKWSGKNCRRNGANPANSVEGIKLNRK